MEIFYLLLRENDETVVKRLALPFDIFPTRCNITEFDVCLSVHRCICVEKKPN